MERQYHIYLRDQNLQTVGELTPSQLEMNLRFNDISTFVLSFSLDSEDAVNVLPLVKRPRAKAGIIVVRDGTPIISGPFLNFQIKGDKDGNETLEVSGVDDTYLLATRLAVPKNAAGEYYYPFDGENYSIFNGKAESALHFHVRNNLGSGAGARAYGGLQQATDLARGKTVYTRARFDNLLLLCQAIASTSGLGFKIIQDAGAPTFKVYEPEDKSSYIVFSKGRGNLAEYEYTVEAPEANVIIAGGSGELMSRIFRIGQDDDSVNLYGRIEAFIDKQESGGSTPEEKAEIDDAIIKELGDKKEKRGIKITPIDIEPIQFGRDYDLGDKVSLEVQDEVYQDILREVKIVLDENGETVSPSIQSQSASEGQIRFLTKKKWRDFEERLSKLERR